MSRRRAALFFASLLALAGLGLGARTTPAWVWNTTASAPTGLYWLSPARTVRVGDLVAVRPPDAQAAWMARRGYLPSGAVLVKRVVALAPSRVCRFGPRVTVDGALRALAEDADRRGRPLPRWAGCRRLAGSDLFLLNAAPRSLDGRYLGPLPRAAVVGRLRPILLSGSLADAG